MSAKRAGDGRASLPDVVPVPARAAALRSQSDAFVVPALIADAGERTVRRFVEFFVATIRNRNTRAAYHRAVQRFFDWCDQNGVAQLVDIEPVHIAAYIESLQDGLAKPSVKQHLAAMRMLFDWLVAGGVLPMNPAAPVRGPKYTIKRGKTPVLSGPEARTLLNAIDTSTIIGLRDRAIIALLTYSFARVGAAVAMRVEDYYRAGKRWRIRLHEKGRQAP